MSLHWVRAGYSRWLEPPQYDLRNRPSLGSELYGIMIWWGERWLLSLQADGDWIDLGADTKAAMAKGMEIAAQKAPLRAIN